jgi:hypothetical protein
MQSWLIKPGPIKCSEARKQLIRRFAAAAMLAEQLESRLANACAPKERPCS